MIETHCIVSFKNAVIRTALKMHRPAYHKQKFMHHNAEHVAGDNCHRFFIIGRKKLCYEYILWAFSIWIIDETSHPVLIFFLQDHNFLGRSLYNKTYTQKNTFHVHYVYNKKPILFSLQFSPPLCVLFSIYFSFLFTCRAFIASTKCNQQSLAIFHFLTPSLISIYVKCPASIQSTHKIWTCTFIAFSRFSSSNLGQLLT